MLAVAASEAELVPRSSRMRAVSTMAAINGPQSIAGVGEPRRSRAADGGSALEAQGYSLLRLRVSLRVALAAQEEMLRAVRAESALRGLESRPPRCRSSRM